MLEVLVALQHFYFDVLQYEITYDAPNGDAVTIINYGVLEKILVFELDDDPFWRDLRTKTILLALISPFKTNGVDAALQTVFYKPSESPAALVTDLRNIKACIGRVESRGKWGLIDRDSQLVQPSFAVGEQDESEDDV